MAGSCERGHLVLEPLWPLGKGDVRPCQESAFVASPLPKQLTHQCRHGDANEVLQLLGAQCAQLASGDEVVALDLLGPLSAEEVGFTCHCDESVWRRGEEERAGREEEGGGKGGGRWEDNVEQLLRAH